MRLILPKAAAMAATLVVALLPPTGRLVGLAAPTPIQHVVILMQENHTFDNVLGKLCVIDVRCNGVTSGKISTGATIPLSTATDKVPNIAHDHDPQVVAVDGGKMDHFDLLRNCGAPAYACMSQFNPTQIPNLAALARAFAISDATFQLDLAASWGSHLELVTSNLDGFTGGNPSAPTPPGAVFGAGWGCDSGRYTWWIAPGATKKQSVPSCVPFPDGTGAVAPTPVKWVPTLMDSMDKAGLTYKLYAGSSNITPGVAFQSSGYQWAICPTFADCGQTAQKSHMVIANKVLTDAAAGTLPAVSIVTPTGHNSQHNGNSMLTGDNWIGSVVSAIQNGPNWASTAIFITYDDCGCFYDHVAPPAAGLGPRMPVVIVSPYAIAGHTDSNVANMASFMAYIEHNFGLAPLGTTDATAYNFSGSFNYAQTPLRGAALVVSPVTPYQANLNDADPTDTT